MSFGKLAESFDRDWQAVEKVFDANSHVHAFNHWVVTEKNTPKKIDPDSSPSEEEKQSKLTEFQEKEFYFLSVAATLIKKNLMFHVYVIENVGQNIHARKPDSRNFNNFIWNHAEIDKFFTQNNEKWWKLSFTHFTFHANGENFFLVHLDYRNFAHDLSLILTKLNCGWEWEAVYVLKKLNIGRWQKWAYSLSPENISAFMIFG